LNFAVHRTGGVLPYDDAPQDWSSTSMSGVADLVAAPLAVCTQGGCSDGDACTADFCNLELGCYSTIQSSPCDDADPCTADSCDVVDGCSNEPIPFCVDGVIQIPAGDARGRSLLALLLAAAGALLVFRRPAPSR
jgi:hypothetical protein